MSKRLQPGEVLCSTVSGARFIVIRTGTALGMPSIDGVALFRGQLRPCSTMAQLRADCELQGGLRYTDPVTGLMLQCIWPGRGSLRYEGRWLPLEGEEYKRPQGSMRIRTCQSATIDLRGNG